MFALTFACVMYRKRKFEIVTFEILAAAADVAAVQQRNATGFI